MSRATISFDAGVRRHPDGGYVCCYGWVINQDGATLDRGFHYELTENNPGSSAAELEAMRVALSSGLNKGLSADQVRVVGDNQSVIGMCCGESKPSSESSVTGVEKIWNLSKRFDNISFKWVPRESNVESDALCSKAYRDALNDAGRGKLMSKIHARARSLLGKRFSPKIMDKWVESVTGRTSLLRASTKDLEQLLANVSTIELIGAEIH